MKKHIIYDKLKKDIAGDIVLLKDLDHPYLISPPDIILAAPERLLAIFIANSYETNSPTRLISRFASAKLALPDTTTFILLEPKISLKNAFQIEHSFDEVLGNTQFWKFCARFSIEGIKRRWKPIPTKIKDKHFQRSHFLFHESEKHLMKEKTDEDLDDCLKRLIKEYGYKRVQYPPQGQTTFSSRTFFRHKFHYLSQAKIGNKKSISSKLAHRFLFSIGISHVMDNGIPYQQEHAYSLLLVDDTPYYKYDKLKYLRCAAFSGKMGDVRAESA